ncbi:MAG: DNA pilot protein [Microviridae sp.]|nr:MAG: DNA pilot protein [Microviridae sp.]
MSAVLGSIVSGLANGVVGAVGNIIAGNQQAKAQKAANQANMELAKYSYDKNLEQWNRENAYNSPAAQMQRYRDAGLNPNLIYSQQNTAGSSPQMSAPQIAPVTGQAQGLQNAFNTISQMANFVLGLERQKAEIAKIHADTHSIEYMNKLNDYFYNDEVAQRNRNYSFQDFMYQLNTKKNSAEWDFRKSQLANLAALLPYEFDYKKEKLLTDYNNYQDLMTARLRGMNASASLAEENKNLAHLRGLELSAKLPFVARLMAAQIAGQEFLNTIRDNAGNHTWRNFGFSSKYFNLNLGGVADAFKDLFNFFTGD